MPAHAPDSSVLLPPAPLLAGPQVLLEWQRFKTQLALRQNWWLRRHRPYQPLFVLATGRSGVSALLAHLNHHPTIALLGDVFSPRLPIGPRRDSLPRHAALAHLRRCLQSQNTPIRGCTIMLDRLATSGLTLSHLHTTFPNAKYIVFYRQSLAHQYVSLQFDRAAADCRHDPITIQSSDLRKYCDDIRRTYCEALRHPCLHSAALLTYEELATNAMHALQPQLLPLLGLENDPPRPAPHKYNSPPLTLRIANYAQVASLLSSPLCRQHHHAPSEPITRQRAA